MAVATSEALVVYGGGVVPLLEPCPDVGISHLANSCGTAQVAGGLGGMGALVTVRVSLASSPVSFVPIKRFSESLLYVPSF